MQQTHGLSGALDGLRVVDLSRILAGPWCTQNLADLGASVLKIERPVTGDDTRAWGPPFVQAPGGEAVSAYFLSCNRGKQSVALDFTEPASHAWLLRQIRDADVLVENYKAGALARHGLDYAALAAINPGLIYLSITGFGQSGPFAHKPGYDYVFQGLGGLMGYTGVADGEEGAGPLRTGVAVVDLMTGMYATSAVLAAVVQRQRTGRGQHIDLALLDVAVAMNANQAANYLVSGENPRRTGNAHPNCAPYEVFACAVRRPVLRAGHGLAPGRALCQQCRAPDRHGAAAPAAARGAGPLAAAGPDRCAGHRPGALGLHQHHGAGLRPSAGAAPPDAADGGAPAAGHAEAGAQPHGAGRQWRPGAAAARARCGAAGPLNP